MDNHRRNMADQRDIAQQLIVALQEAQMSEIVVFYAGKRQRKVIFTKRCRLAAWQQGHRLPFPHAPQLRCLKLHLQIR
ncbi:hypothetical protein D3C78_1104420 [compost metagenome]